MLLAWRCRRRGICEWLVLWGCSRGQAFSRGLTAGLVGRFVVGDWRRKGRAARSHNLGIIDMADRGSIGIDGQISEDISKRQSRYGGMTELMRCSLQLNKRKERHFCSPALRNAYFRPPLFGLQFTGSCPLSRDGGRLCFGRRSRYPGILGLPEGSSFLPHRSALA